MERLLFAMVLACMAIALLATFLVGAKMKQKFITNYKVSIIIAVIYSMLILVRELTKIPVIDALIINMLIFLSMLLFRSIYCEYCKLLNKSEEHMMTLLIIRVVPFIGGVFLLIEFLQSLSQQEAVMTFNLPLLDLMKHMAVVYQVYVVVCLFALNLKLRRVTLNKYQHIFRSNMLALVVYFLLLLMEYFFSDNIDTVFFSGMIYIVAVGFCVVNEVTEECLYESKVFHKKIVKLNEQVEVPEEEHTRDRLTGVFNREYFIRHIRTFDKDDASLSVVVAQLYGVKLINDVYGYDYGDEVIQEVLSIMDKVFSGSTIARVNGGEFAILQSGLSEIEIKEQIAMTKNICHNKEGFVIDVHFGYGIRGQSDMLLYDLFKHAEAHLYDQRLKLNRNRQDEIAQMLYLNFGMRMPALSKHLKRCSMMAENFARYMKYDEGFVLRCKQAALLHDIGLLSMPYIKDYDMTFKDAFEEDCYKNHTAKGYDIIVEAGIQSVIAKAILHHHEKIDGTGYPDQLQGDEIPIMSQIIGLVDYVDVLMETGTLENELVSILSLKTGLVFSKELVDNMIEFLKFKEIIVERKVNELN